MTFDPNQKFVHISERRTDGFVEFDFAIGEPELFVEMIMSEAAFEDFCATNRVTYLAERPRSGSEVWDWRLDDATGRRTGN